MSSKQFTKDSGWVSHTICSQSSKSLDERLSDDKYTQKKQTGGLLP